VNVLKPHLETTVFTLLAAGKSQHEISRVTKIDRKTIRRLNQSFIAECEFAALRRHRLSA
jgi:transposase-like protein